jgi:prepilin-type N-terminal cleavage/methylation domain-containing protein
MPTHRALVAPRREPRTAERSDGFSVIEVMIAIAVIGTVMAAMAPFLAQSMVVTSDQRSSQVAVEIANDALERVRALKPTSLLAGRGENAVRSQWAAAPDETDDLLAMTKLVWDADAKSADAGEKAPLPTAAVPVEVSGVTYRQNWYVGHCWQPKVTGSTVADCTVPTTPAATDLPFFRIVATVTWSQNSCPSGACIYVASTLVSIDKDATFDLKRPPPTITPLAAQIGYVGVPVTDLPIPVSGGWMPRTWSWTGLPPGLTLPSDTGTITGTPTTAGTYKVTVTVTDREKRIDDATFTWTISALPAVTSPGAQTSRVGTPVSLTMATTGGHQPMSAWTATGLPTGLSIDPATGIISGTPTTERKTAAPVTVTVTDAGNKTASVTFTWRVLTAVVITNPGAQTFASGSVAPANTVMHASGGLGPYTWTAIGLPDGYTMDTAGRITGTATNGSRFVVQLTAKDSAGGTATLSVVAIVTPRLNELTVPTPATTDRTTSVGTAVTQTVSASGGSPGYTWTAAGLPPGVAFSTAGALSGSPTKAGTYVAKLTVKDTTGKLAHLMFTWTVNP